PELLDAGHHLDGGEAGKTRLLRLLDEGRSPPRHDGVADIFVDNAAMGVDRRRHGREIEVHDLDEAARGDAFGQRRKTLHVAKHDGPDAALTFARGDSPLIDQAIGDARIDVAPERLADALVLAQPLDHAVEGLRELADLVAGGDVDRTVEPASL